MLFIPAAHAESIIPPDRAEAPATSSEAVQLVDVDSLAKATAHLYDVNETHFDMVMNCESGGLDTAVGDKGLAYGPMQFHRETFDWMKQKANLPLLEYTNPQDQLTLAAWAFAHGYQNNWSCFSIEKAKDWQ